MKYLIKLSLIAVAILSLTGCGQNEEITPQNQNQGQQATQSTANTVNNNDQNLDQDKTSPEVARKNLGQSLENLSTNI